MNDRDQLAWDIFFGNVAAMQFHPRNNQLEKTDLEIRATITRCADIADAMLYERKLRASHLGSRS